MKWPIVPILSAACLFAQPPKPESAQAFECYVQSAEARMQGGGVFLATDSDSALRDQLVRGRKIVTIPAQGSNPHKLPGGMLYDWIGVVFIPNTTLERTIRMLQDYDHRAQYFS